LIQRLAGEYPANGPGAYAIAAQGDHILFAHGFGLANVELGIPLTADSVLRIASLTKQFTAAAVLRLVAAQTLRLDEPLQSVPGNWPPSWRTLTIRALLNQTTGLTDDLSPLARTLMKDRAPDQLLALYKDRPLDWIAGKKWRYSNLNYWILGKVIENVSGESYVDFVRKYVLANEMKRTRYGSHDAIIIGRAAGYEKGGNGRWINAPYFSPTLGYSAGGFLSTPADMAAWYAALSRGAVIPRSLLSLALTSGKTTDGGATGYGFGWYVSEENGRVIARHGGSTFGFQSSISWVPSCGLFAGVFKNSNDERGEPDADARALLHAAMPRCDRR